MCSGTPLVSITSTIVSITPKLDVFVLADLIAFDNVLGRHFVASLLIHLPVADAPAP
jgi:hypothetical protein